MIKIIILIIKIKKNNHNHNNKCFLTYITSSWESAPTTYRQFIKFIFMSHII